MRNDYKKYRTMGYEASEALRQARLPKCDYGLGSLYDCIQKGQMIETDALADGYQIKLECFYEDYADVPWDFYESYGEVIVDTRHQEVIGNGNVEMWHGDRGHFSYRYGWQEAVRKTRKEFDEYRPKWGKTMRQDYALMRVRSELKWFKDFCRDEWSYIWIKGTLLFDGEEVAEESIGGIDSNDWKSCSEEVIEQLIRESKARVYAGSTVGCV